MSTLRFLEKEFLFQTVFISKIPRALSETTGPIETPNFSIKQPERALSEAPSRQRTPSFQGRRIACLSRKELIDRPYANVLFNQRLRLRIPTPNASITSPQHPRREREKITKKEGNIWVRDFRKNEEQGRTRRNTSRIWIRCGTDASKKGRVKRYTHTHTLHFQKRNKCSFMYPLLHYNLWVWI